MKLERLLNLRRLIKINKRVRSYGTSYQSYEELITFSNGRQLRLESGNVATLTDGSAEGSSGDTSVLVTAVAKTKPSGSNFVPLTVDYQENYAAAGRIPMNALRRDYRSSDRDILVSRCVDRSLRPLFRDGYSYETQIICNTMQIDGVNDPDIIAINTASAALAVSDIPWAGPVGAVRVGYVDNEVLINPTRRELNFSSLNLIVTAIHQNLVVMLEGSANNILQQDLLKAIKVGVKEAQVIVHAIEKLQKKMGKPKRELVKGPQLSSEICEAVESLSKIRLGEIFHNYSHDKLNRDIAVSTLKVDVVHKIKGDFVNFEFTLVENYFDKVCKEVFRDTIFEDRRCDGRELDEIRPITCEIDMYRSLHGCSRFRRGQTQVGCTVTLDSIESAMKLDPVAVLASGIKKKNFFVNYKFPPYATKEIGRVGVTGRREIGHGILAEKGLFPIIPPNYDFAIRLQSEVLESNGSSSMATVCGGTLALLDAGVPIVMPAAGVAIGLVTKYSNEDTKHIKDYRLITDILGIEDYMGDMDFKLAGTKKGITALQADIKIPGLPLKLVMEAIQLATNAKSKILDTMSKCIDKPRTDPKEKWPVVEKLDIETHKKLRMYSKKSSKLKELFYKTGASIYDSDANTSYIFAPNRDALEDAKEILSDLIKSDPTADLKNGEIYRATIAEIRDVGVMVTLLPNMQPVLLPNSQLDLRQIVHPSVLNLKVGEEIFVKYLGRDPASGHMRLSRKATLMQKDF